MDDKAKNKSNSKVKIIFILHILLMVFSLCGICSKKAAGEAFLSFRFCMYYAIMILIMGVYAIAWQQIIKRLPLTTAYANKAVTVVWGLVWGIVVFGEKLTIGKVIGVIMVILGMIIFSLSDEKVTEKEGGDDHEI